MTARREANSGPGSRPEPAVCWNSAEMAPIAGAPERWRVATLGSAMRRARGGLVFGRKQAANRPAPLCRTAPGRSCRRVFANACRRQSVVCRLARTNEAYLRASAPRWCRTAPASYGAGVCFAPAVPAMVQWSLSGPFFPPPWRSVRQQQCSDVGGFRICRCSAAGYSGDDRAGSAGTAVDRVRKHL